MGESTYRLSIIIFGLCRLSVNLGKSLTKRVNHLYSFFNSHSLNSKQVQNFFIHRQFIFLIAMELHFKSGLFSYAIVCFNFVSKD